MKFRDYGFDWIVWALFLAVPLLVFWQISTSLAEQGVASGGPMENAAIFPRIVAWLMIGLSLINGARILLGRVSQKSPVEGTATTGLALTCTGLFLVYLLCLKPVGYYLATPILLCALLRLFGIGWLGSAIAALGMTVVVAGVFEGLLNVVLPLGFLKFTLFG